MNDWISWHGGECPVKKGTLVDVKYRSGKVLSNLSALIDTDEHPCYGVLESHWHRECLHNDIVAYRLSEEAEKIPAGWIKHDGKGMPVDGEVGVDVILRSAGQSKVPRAASDWHWCWSSEEPVIGDIVCWKLAENAEKASPVKSDGGSSGYYQITIKNEKGEEFHCETNDVLYALVGGDFDMSNIIKACRRMYEASQGRGKQGTDIAYDVKKIKYFADDFAQRFGNA